MAVTFGDSVPSRIRLWIGGAEVWLVPNAANDAMVVDTEYAHIQLGSMNVARVERKDMVETGEASFHNGLGHLMGAVDWTTGAVNASAPTENSSTARHSRRAFRFRD